MVELRNKLCPVGIEGLRLGLPQTAEVRSLYRKVKVIRGTQVS